jgi:tetratricopeptide (TPR) repeat protein
MKNINFKLFAALLVASVFFSSCAFNRMVKNYDEGIRFTPEHNPLENHGGEVAANVKGNIRDAYFHKKAVLELTPVLKYDGIEKELNTLVLRGSGTTTQGMMIRRDGASGFDLNNTFGFEPEMIASELYIQARIYREGREGNATELPERKVADGVINTSQRIDKTDQDISLAPHEYEKETIITRSGDVYFAYMRHNLNWRLPLNQKEESKARLAEVKSFLEKGWEIKSIEVNAWASPEGEVAFNKELSENRAETGKKHLHGLLTDVAKVIGKEIDHSKVNVKARGEDFDGFMTRLNASNLPDKQAIANVINAQIAPAERERRIKDMTLIYAEIEKILEPLRRAEIVVHAFEPKKTDAEMAALSTSNPSQLDEKELLYAATLTDNLQTKLAIYKSAQELFPRSYKGFNNAAYVNIKLGNPEAAARDLEKANQLAPNNGLVLNNLGVVAFWAGDVENAKSYFESAKAQGVNTNFNLCNLMILEGNYQGAQTSFAGRTCSYNVALTQVLAGNLQGAKTNLECAPKTAHAAYLKAIIAARENNTSAMIQNLKNAIELNPAYKEEAKTDREFIRYFANTEFMQLVN